MPKSKGEEIKGTFVFERNSKTYHRFRIETDAGIVGSVYIPKDMDPIPAKIILEPPENYSI